MREDSHATQRRPEAWATRGRIAALAVVGGLTLALAGATQARRDPAWWLPSEVTLETARQAESFEHAALAQLTLVRPAGETWTVALSEADMNAWLATRLAAWLSNRGMQGLPAGAVVQCRLADNRLWVGLSVGSEVVWIAGAVDVDGDAVRMVADEAGVGRLPLPVALVRGRLGAEFANVLGAGVPMSGIAVDGRRRVRLEAITARAGELVVRARTDVQ